LNDKGFRQRIKQFKARQRDEDQPAVEKKPPKLEIPKLPAVSEKKPPAAETAKFSEYDVLIHHERPGAGA
jgi:hypothetical protein